MFFAISKNQKKKKRCDTTLKPYYIVRYSRACSKFALSRSVFIKIYFDVALGGILSTRQNSSKEPTRWAIFEKRASHSACSGRGFWRSSFLNSTRWATWSGLINRSSGMPLQPFFSSLQQTQPLARACARHLRSSISSSCFIGLRYKIVVFGVLQLKPPALRAYVCNMMLTTKAALVDIYAAAPYPYRLGEIIGLAPGLIRHLIRAFHKYGL